MANTTLQNCQRAIILLWFASLAAITTLLTVRLIKKKIDLRSRPKQEEEPPSESAADKYKQSQVTQHQFQKEAVRSTALSDNDTCTQIFMKKMCEYNVIFNPLLLLAPLNFVLGRSMAFSVVIFIASATCCYIFNVFKVHRTCVESKAGRLFIEMLWIVLSALLIVNIWTTSVSPVLYRLKSST